VSAAAIQIAKLWGCRVIATAGTDEKLAKMSEYGIDVPLNYRTQDWMSEIRKVTGKRGVDVAIDHVGADTMEKSVAVLAAGGCMVTCGTTSGAEIRLNFRRIFFKNLSVIGSTMGSRAEFFDILKHVASGRLRAVIDRVLPLEQCAEAHRVLENREATGKVVLVPPWSATATSPSLR
jgi:NADPH:quinone reductase-like Zn-dependent oxidoreductase